MATKCIFCEKILEFGSSVFLEENMDKLENLMQATEFDVTKLLKNSLVCKTCNDMIYDFFDFKSTFMEKEDELLNYVNCESKVDLWKVLVSKGELQKRNDMDQVKICRICFKQGKMDYQEIKSYQHILATVVSTCLPEFDMFFTSKTLICSDCNRILLKYYNFLMICSEALKGNSVLEDPLLLENEPLDKRKQTQNNDLEEPSTSEESLLVPAVPKKRGRGRPRTKPFRPVIKKVQICNKPIDLDPPKVRAKRYRHSFECQICPGTFDSIQSMLSHLEHHTKQTSFVCWKCGHQCNTIYDLKVHFTTHKFALYKTIQEEIESEEEGDEDDSKKNAKRKAKKLSEETARNEDLVECRLCLKHMKYFPSFRNHLRKHCHSKQFHCHMCLYDSCNINSFKLHMSSVHGIFDPSPPAADCSAYALTATAHEDYKITKDYIRKKDKIWTGRGKELVESALYKVLSRKFEPRKEKDGQSSAQHADPITQKTQTAEANSMAYCCGHCSGVFYSIDALDEHICTTPPGKSETATAEEKSSTDDKPIEGDYKCSFCLLCFLTLKELDTHVCPADSEAPADTKTFQCSKCSEEFKSNVDLSAHICSKSETSTIHQPTVSEKEDQFECFCCFSDFASYDSFAEHGCFKANSPASTNSFEGVTKNPSHSLVKQEHQFECSQCYLAFETEFDLSQHACTDLNISSNDLEMILKKEDNLECSNCNATFYTEDESRKHKCANIVVKSESEECSDKDLHNNAMKDKEKPNKKEIINNIAKIFGVKIIEGAIDKDRQTVEKKFDCVGCEFTTSKKKDLLIHFYHCEKVKKCHYCPYRTNVSQKLEMHCYTVHDIIIFSCRHCRFITSMEENFQAHIALHKDGLDEDDIMWEDVADNQEIADDSIDKEITSDAEDTGSQPVRLIESNALINSLISSDAKQIEDDAEVILPDSFVDDKLSTYVDKPDLIQFEDDLQPSKPTETKTDSNKPVVSESITTHKDITTNTANVSQDTDVIDIDSDSEDEFIESTESRMEDASTVVEKICTIDADDASELISQGIPVVSESSLSQFQSFIVDSEKEADSFSNKNIPLETEENSIGSSIFVTDNDDSDNGNDNDKEIDGPDIDIDDTNEDVTILDSNVVENLMKTAKNVLNITDDDENKNLNSTATKRKKSLKNDAFTKKTKVRIQQSKSKPKKNPMPTIKTINTMVDDDCIYIIDDDEVEERQQTRDIRDDDNDSIRELTEEEVSSINEDDDCVVVAEDVDKTSKTSWRKKKPSEPNKIKRPANAFILFTKKVQVEIKKNFPNVSGKELQQIIANSWKGMSNEEKWPFMEEARLHRILFARENPGLRPSQTRKQNRQKSVQKQVPAKPVQVELQWDEDEEILIE